MESVKDKVEKRVKAEELKQQIIKILSKLAENEQLFERVIDIGIRFIEKQLGLSRDKLILEELILCKEFEDVNQIRKCIELIIKEHTK